jgi:alanine dehydrogenase
MAGANACKIAVAMGAHVSVLDVDPARLRYLHDILGGHLTTVMSNRANVADEVREADLVIGAVLIPGARAPRLVSRKLVRAMRPGAAIVDISIDQGGCIETSRPTTHHEPIYVVDGVVHYAVTNMPAIVPHTSTYALTNATLHHALNLADRGFAAAVSESRPLLRGVNTYRGHVTHEGVASAFRRAHRPLEELL